MWGYKAAAAAKGKKREVPERMESHSEEVEEEVLLKRNRSAPPASLRIPEAGPLPSQTLPSPPLPSPVAPFAVGTSFANL